MKSRLIATIFCLSLPLFFVFQTPAFAQIPSSIDGIRMIMEPPVPAPDQNTTIRLESYITDLNGASIVWLVNGKSFAQGTGKTSISLRAPSLGKTTTILVVIMTVEGREVKKTHSLRSGGVDIVWESQGYTPPFYQGKAFFAYENPLRITAIPHLVGPDGKQIDPKSLMYKWTKNTKVIQDQSGYGRQTLLVKEDIPRDVDIEVEVSTRNGSDKARGNISLSPGDPSISFYEDDSLYGVLYNKALSNTVELSNQEMTIRAVPYSFTILKNTPLSYAWSINGLGRSDLSQEETIVLRTKGDVEGRSAIGLEIRHTDNILQGARKSVSVQFKKRATSPNVTF